MSTPAVNQKLVLNRDYTLTTLTGHSIFFKKNVPTHVPKPAWSAALAIGAILPDGTPPEVEGEKVFVPPPSDPEERATQILKAFDVIVAKNEREDFTAAGIPTNAAVAALTGFKVQSKEVSAVWQYKKDSEAEDTNGERG